MVWCRATKFAMSDYWIQKKVFTLNIFIPYGEEMLLWFLTTICNMQEAMLLKDVINHTEFKSPVFKIKIIKKSCHTKIIIYTHLNITN